MCYSLNQDLIQYAIDLAAVNILLTNGTLIDVSLNRWEVTSFIMYIYCSLFGAFSTLTILSNMRNRKWQIPPRFMLLHITSDLAIENSFLAVEFFFYVFDTTVCNVLLSIRYDTFGVKNLNNDKCSPLAVNLMFWVFWGGCLRWGKWQINIMRKPVLKGILYLWKRCSVGYEWDIPCRLRHLDVVLDKNLFIF